MSRSIYKIYNPDKMLEGLRKAHQTIDATIGCHRQKPFESDEERLEYFLKMYGEMTEKEIAK